MQLGFVWVLLDEEPAWGVRLDNLHVNPQLKGTGIGYALFQAAREWTAQMMPDAAMHLTLSAGAALSLAGFATGMTYEARRKTWAPRSVPSAAGTLLVKRIGYSPLRAGRMQIPFGCVSCSGSL